MIAEPSTPDSAAVHASVSGVVLSVARFPHPCGKHILAAEIENDGMDSSVEMTGLDSPWKETAPQEIVRKISSCGVVGMGGVGVPTQIKLLPPANKPIDTFIVNCSEGEPLMAADSRLIKEHVEEILTGVLIAKKILGAKRAFVVLDCKAADTTVELTSACKEPKYAELSLVRIQPKYPQSEEKVLVRTLTKREVPSGGDPADVGCVVHNAATVFAISQAIANGIPVYQRALTVGGPCTPGRKNLLVRIGTSVRNVLEYCGTDSARTKKVVLGGIMHGLALPELDTPVIKTTGGIFALDSLVPGISKYNCIRCGHCTRVCPMRLSPAYLRRFVVKNNMDDATRWGISDCMECGSCAYVCPSKINLVHFMKLGKYRIAAATGARSAPEAA